jgi:hypothetical protein
MKTVFKEGMKVYDQLNFPNKKGVIVEISNDENDPYPVGVSFENEAGRYYYTPEGCFYKEQISTLSTKPYKVELVGFEQKSPTPTYEEALKEAHRKDEYYYLPNDLEAPSEELADAAVALLKLLFLRDYYNKGWQPDWNNNYFKFCIEFEAEEICNRNHFYNSRVMCFKTEEIRDKFLKEQRELLEIAKPLL